MAVNNSLQANNRQDFIENGMAFSAYLSQDAVKRKVNDVIGCLLYTSDAADDSNIV